MKETNSITEGSVSEPQIYHYPGVACTAVAIPFLIPGEGDGRERVYHRYEQHKGDSRAVISWAPGRGGLPYPHIEAFGDEDALFGAYPCLRGPLHGATTGWNLQPYHAAQDIFQRWRDERMPNVDLMPIELQGKCCFVIRRYGWMKKPHYDHLTLPIGLLEFRPGENGATAALHVANTVADLAFVHPELRPALDRGLRQSFALHLERKKTCHANFNDCCLRDPRVTVLPLKGAGQYLLVRRRFPAPAGTGRDIYTLLAWTGDDAAAESLSTDYATLDALVREHPDLEAPLVKYYQDVVPVTGGGAA